MPDLDKLDPNPGHPHTHYQHESGQDRKGPFLKRIHRSWIFWVALLLMLLAMFVFIRSVDLSVPPNNAPARQAVP